MYKESMCQGCEQHEIKKVEIIMTYFWFFALLSSQSAFTSVQNHFGISSNDIRSNESPYRLSWDNAPMRTRWMRGHSDRDLWPSTCLSFSLGGRPSQIWRNSCCMARMRHTCMDNKKTSLALSNINYFHVNNKTGKQHPGHPRQFIILYHTAKKATDAHILDKLNICFGFSLFTLTLSLQRK